MQKKQPPKPTPPPKARDREEQAFLAALDADPNNMTARVVYADWLDERGRPEAAGWRAMGQLGVVCHYFHGEPCWGVYSDLYDVRHIVGQKCHVAYSWVAEVDTTKHVHVSYDRSAVFGAKHDVRQITILKALALAFGKLPAWKQTEILEAKSETV